jgi:cell division ATPase FtsA
MKKTNVVIDLSIEDYIKSYIEKSDSNKTKIYNKNKVERIGLDGCNTIDTFKAIQSISKAYNLAVKNINEKIDETVIIIGQDYVKMPVVDVEINMENKIITKNDITKILQDMVINHEYYNDYIAIQVQSAWFVLDDDISVLNPVNYKTSILRCYSLIYFVDNNIYSNFQEIFSKCGIINPRFKAMFFERKHKYELDIMGNLIELEFLSAFEKKSSFGKWLHERRFFKMIL